MNRLRKAIIADVTEDMSMVGEMTECHEELVAAFNAMPGATPITDADLDAEFE
jgi:hypothetical protein